MIDHKVYKKSLQQIYNLNLLECYWPVNDSYSVKVITFQT